MEHIFINELNVDDKDIGIYYCKDKQIKKSKVGKDFLSLILSDKTGWIDTKIWEIDGFTDKFEKGDYVKVEYRISEYLGKKQMSVLRIRKAEEWEYNVENYIKASERSFDNLYEEFNALISKVDNEYSIALINKILDDEDLASKFFNHTAAKSIHHNYIRGLLEHTIGLMRMCNYFAENYGADLNIMLPACLYHDIGKVYEITLPPESEYTFDGTLLGHLVIGYEILSKNIDKISNFPPKLATNIKHCVLAHHGKLEYGSPKVPATLEAMALHLADFCDSRLVTFISELSELGENESKGSYNKLLETVIYKTEY